MEYKVVLTSSAQIQFRNILNNLFYELESQQAATNIVNDLMIRFRGFLMWLAA